MTTTRHLQFDDNTYTVNLDRGWEQLEILYGGEVVALIEPNAMHTSLRDAFTARPIVHLDIKWEDVPRQVSRIAHLVLEMYRDAGRDVTPAPYRNRRRVGRPSHHIPS